MTGAVPSASPAATTSGTRSIAGAISAASSWPIRKVSSLDGSTTIVVVFTTVNWGPRNGATVTGAGTRSKRGTVGSVGATAGRDAGRAQDQSTSALSITTPPTPAEPCRRLRCLVEPEERNGIVVEDVALLRGGQERRRLDPFNRPADCL